MPATRKPGKRSVCPRISIALLRYRNPRNIPSVPGFAPGFLPVLMRLLYSHFEMRGILLVVMGAALTVSCGRQAGVYPMPEQKRTDLGPDPGGLGAFITMDDPLVDEYLVKDMSNEKGFRRWAFLHPELRFRVKETGHLKFAAEFAIPEVTYKVTGPVTVECAVNGRTLGTMRCDHAGDFRLEKAVPEGLIKAGEVVRVTFEANPRWIAPEDGAQLSFLLRSAGFHQ